MTDTVALDIETHDPELKKFGPSWQLGQGKILGVAISTDTEDYYIEDITDPKLRELIRDKNIVGANIIYDISWLMSQGFDFSEVVNIYDVQIAERLLDSSADNVKLDTLAGKYLGESKKEDELEAYAEENGIDDYKGNLHLMPKDILAQYAKMDTNLTLRIWKLQEPKLRDANLSTAFNTEAKLQLVLAKMKANGVKVNVEKAKLLNFEMQAVCDRYLLNIKEEYGIDLNSIGTDDEKKKLKTILEEAGITVPTTPKDGKISITNHFLETNADNHPICSIVKTYREIQKLRKDFVEYGILNREQNGIIKCDFFPLKTDNEWGSENGAGTGRLSSANPNLQQVPIRNEEWGNRIRDLFIPMSDAYEWVKFDYSQQEVRIMVHYACLLNLPGADKVAKIYVEDPDADFYLMAQKICNDLGHDISRSQCKTFVLGKQYGMGKAKTALKLGMTAADTDKLRNAFDKAIPFVKMMADYCKNVATDRGYIKTISGRRIYFNHWVPAKFSREYFKPLRYAEALEAFEGESLTRANTFRALNYLIQGSAADMIKVAMNAVYYKLGIVPYLSVHDELDVPVFKNRPESKLLIQSIKEEMENTFKLEVPLICDVEIGDSWGTVKEYIC